MALSFYMLGFSYAYTKLETGAGALILFGVVQIVMFGVAVFTREPLPRYRVIGASIAFGGLCYLLVPTASLAMDPFAVGLMVLAGLGWGGYSIFGRNAGPACLQPLPVLRFFCHCAPPSCGSLHLRHP